MDNLTLEVREIYEVRIDHPKGPDTGCRKVEGHRRSQTAGSHQEYLRVGQSPLPFRAHLGENEVPGIAEEVFPLKARVGRARGPCF